MKELFFWRTWDREFKTIYQFLLLITILLLGAYFIILFLGDDIAFDWLITSRLESKPISIGVANIFNIPTTVTTNLSVIQQYFEGSELKISAMSSHVYLGIFSLGLAVSLTIVTYLKRFLFMASVALFVFLLFLIKLNALTLFGLEGNVGNILIFLLFIPLAYYFHDINKSISLKKRLQAFIGLMLLSGILIHFFSKIDAPFVYLSSNIFIPAVIFTVIFILLVGYEIVYTILIITTQSIQDSKTNNTKHFIILTIIYLINLVFAYLRNTGKIDWDIFYINAFALFAISAVLGIWGLKDREVLYSNTLPFYPYNGILYLALFIISLSTIGFHTMQSNDPVLETFEDAIIFGHIGFGFMFFLYIIANFISLLMKNLPVYKVAFKEDNFPYATARLAGLIVVAMFFFFSNKAAMNQAIAGHFISTGDYYHLQGKASPAAENYRYASMYAPNNHRSNYALAHLQSDKKQSVKYMENSIEKNPTPYAYVNTGLNFTRDGKFFDALFTYQKGLSKFPNSDELKNNLAVLYAGTKILDSAVYHLNDISSSEINNETGSTNKLALSVLKDIDFHQSFQSSNTTSTNRLDVNANILAKLVLQPDTILKAEFLSASDPLLNLISYAYINNLGIWSYSNPNDSYLRLIEPLLTHPGNNEYKEQLLFFKALNLYGSGQINDAFQNISELIGSNNGNGTYTFVAGLWSLEQNSPRLALDYFEQSVEQGSLDAKVFIPLIYWLNDRQDEANNLLSDYAKNDSIDSRISTVSRIISTDNQSTKKQIKDYFEGVASISASNILNEIMVSESENNLNKTDALYDQIGNLNPFFTEGVLAAANHFNEKQIKDKAYDILVNNMAINQYSEDLIKAYIDQCFAMGFDSYAENGLLKLLDVLSKEEYDKYEMVFDLKKEQLEQENLDW